MFQSPLEAKRQLCHWQVSYFKAPFRTKLGGFIMNLEEHGVMGSINKNLGFGGYKVKKGHSGRHLLVLLDALIRTLIQQMCCSVH